MKMKSRKFIGRFGSEFKEFRAFALRANAVDLAIAVVLGAAFTAVVQSIVQDLFTPVIAAFFGQTNFEKLYFTVHGSQFHYGLVVNAVITFIVVALMLFFFVVRPLNGLRGRLGLNGDEPLPMAPCPACRSDIDLRARRCPMCTEVLTDGWAGAAQ